jgi:hypothetical protein
VPVRTQVPRAPHADGLLAQSMPTATQVPFTFE